jgi:hypothetical protein
MAHKDCSSPSAPGGSSPPLHEGQQGKEEPQARPEHEAEARVGQGGTQRTRDRTDGTVRRLSTDELIRLAPRLRTYLTSPRPAWPEIIDAADWLCGEMARTNETP